ncbi:MAG TPA: serine-threonine protein kinase, partial [Chloroflexota bacterium]|nr:serine-threonine protein kinase [Chloroflexota bacterium]
GASPVKSVTLLQGAFSHFAFADALPHDRARGGALKGMVSRVDGPITISHSTFDSAVGTLYPLASIVSQDDASAADDLLFRWGAMGHDGAQGAEAAGLPLGRVGQAYPFGRAKIVNLDGNAIIREGGPPAGAHGDIFHPQLAWATLAAAGVVSA